MLNLLRMDLYRLRKSKAVYICLGILLALIAMIFSLLFLFLSPQGQAIACQFGMMDITDIQEFAEAFRDINLLLVFRRSCMDCSEFTIILSILFTVFVYADFKNGFIKNILSVHVNRWNYVESKILAFAIVDAVYLAAAYLFTVLLNWLSGVNVPAADAGTVLIYLLQAWVITVAMLGLVLTVCVLTRSATAGILASITVGSGLLTVILDSVLGLFGMNHWLNYTLYMSLKNAPYSYHLQSSLKGLLVGAVFLIVYTTLAGIVLHKKDI